MTAIDLVVITDGRGEYLSRTMASAHEHIIWPFEQRIMVDDSGEPRYTAWLREQFPAFDIIAHPQRRGLAAAVQTAWAATTADQVFHLEEDFTFNGPIDIGGMSRALWDATYLAQIVLKRQPWSAEEKQAGGIVEMHPDAYDQRFAGSSPVTVHDRIFSLNPCLIPRKIIARGWPDSNEAGMTKLLVDDMFRFAFWGRPGDPPTVTHIGERRTIGWAL